MWRAEQGCKPQLARSGTPENLPLAHPLQSPCTRRFPDTAPASKNQNVTAISVPLRVST